MSKKYGLAVYIGRFQPLHKGHEFVINKAKELAENVLVLVGSSSSSRRVKGPFSFTERKSMIQSVFPDVYIDYIPDFLYEENQWMTEVQDTVALTIQDIKEHKGLKSEKICIIGHNKDDSSYYLKNFPQYAQEFLEHWENVNATEVRTLAYESKFKFIESAVSTQVYKFLTEKWKTSESYKTLVQEYKYIQDYKKSWSGSPYPPIFYTVDSIVLQSGHILLVERGTYPGKGLFALPGGFIQENETSLESAIRELREETKLKVPVPVLKGSVEYSKIFDKPDRSERGRTITNAFLFQLDNTQELPKVKGNDDAKNAFWIPLSEFYSMEEKMFEDHYHIIRNMIDNR